MLPGICAIPLMAHVQGALKKGDCTYLIHQKGMKAKLIAWRP